tara:strand:- start:4966 stop:5892 length:927 start_codon:yes stop_codon:yes gene_type:complete
MIVKIFNKVGLRAYVFSFAFSLAAIFLINYCKHHKDWSLNNIFEILVLWVIFALFTLYVSYLQSKKLSSKLSGIHLLTFPLVFLFFPNGPGLVISKIIIGIILVYSEHLFIRAFFTKPKNKYLFDLSILISIIVLFNKALLIFYVFPFLAAFSQKLFSIKSLIALLFPILFIPFTFYGLAIIAPLDILGPVNYTLKIQPWEYLDQTNADWVWFIILSISIYVTIFKRPKGNEKSSAFLYMTIWLYSSLFIGFLGLNLGQERWLLSFVPAAFFFGVFIENIRSDRLKNSIIFLGVLFIVFFKLFSFEVL